MINNLSFSIKCKITLRNLIIFLFFYIIFFLYCRINVHDNSAFFFSLNLLMLFIFLITAFKPKIGLFLFIFFIPLLNSLTTILEVRSINIPIFLFFGFFLGFILSFLEKDFSNRLSLIERYNYYEREIGVVSFIFLLILVVSLGITVLRYANFFPFITNNYHNLYVAPMLSYSASRFDSTSAIYSSLQYFFNYALGFALLFAIFNLLDKKRDMIITVIILISSAVVASIFSIYQFFVNPYIGSFTDWVNAGRLNSTLSDPNALGAYCVLIFPIFLSFIIFTKKWYLKLLLCLLFIPFMLMVLFSGSRSALIGILLSIIIFLIYGIIRYFKYLATINKRKRKFQLFVILTVILIIVILLTGMLLTNNQFKKSFLKVGLVNRSIQSFDTFSSHIKKDGFIEALKSISNTRYILWNQAINMAKDYPINGVGPGSYIINLPDYLNRFETRVPQIDFTGNYYLQVLAELGFTGLLLILFLFFFIIKKTTQYYKNKKKVNESNIDDWLLLGFFISFITMLIILFFGPHTNFIEIQFTFWIIISFIIVYIKIEQIKKLDETEFSRKPLILDNNLKFTLGQKISLVLLILIFFSSYTINSLTSLSIASAQDRGVFDNGKQQSRAVYGFYKYEKVNQKKVRWTSIDASEVLMKKGNVLIIPIQDAYPKINQKSIKPPKPLIVKIYIDNLLVKTIKLENNLWYDVKVMIPNFTISKFTLTLVMNRDWVPQAIGLNQDTRGLGARVGEYKFEND